MNARSASAPRPQEEAGFSRVVLIAPNRAAAPRDSRFGQNERLGDSVIPRIRGCQPDRAGPGRAQRRSYTAQATQATHLHQILVFKKMIQLMFWRRV